VQNTFSRLVVQKHTVAVLGMDALPSSVACREMADRVDEGRGPVLENECLQL